MVESNDPKFIDALKMLLFDERPEGPIRPLEEIVVVLGVPHSGKSTYIASNYPRGTYDDIIDVYQYQHDEAYPLSVHMPRNRRTLISNALFESDVIEALEQAKTKGSKTGRLILEGTFLKSARRAPLMQSIKNMKHPMAKVICVWISNPQREKMYEGYDGKAVFEMPSVDEGFDEIIVYEANHEGRAGRNGEYGDTDEVSDEVKALIDAHNERDRVTEGDLLGYEVLARSAGKSAEENLLKFWRGEVGVQGRKQKRVEDPKHSEE